MSRHLALLLARLFLLLAVASFAGSALVRLAPGYGIAETDWLLREESRTAAQADRHDGGLLTAYGRYWAGVIQGDLGESLALHVPIRSLFADRLPLSWRNASLGLLLAWLLAGITAVPFAHQMKSLWSAAATALAGVLICIPAGVLALVAVWRQWPPSLAVAYIVFPQLFFTLRGLWSRLGQAPHVLAARARGLTGQALFWRHVLLPALPPMLALAGISVSLAISALIPVEVFCDTPGVGQLIWTSAQARDLPVLVNATLLLTAIVVGVNGVADLAATWWTREA